MMKDNLKIKNSRVPEKIARLFQDSGSGIFSNKINFTQCEMDEYGGAIEAAQIAQNNMRTLASQINDVSNGNYTANVKPRSSRDKLGFALQQMTGVLRNASDVAERVAMGDTSVKVNVMGEKDLLAHSMNKMVDTLNNAAEQADDISSGNYTANVKPRSSRDKLGTALQRMTGVLRNASEVAERVAMGDTSVKVNVMGEKDLLAHSMNKMVDTLNNAAEQADDISSGNYTANVKPRSSRDKLGTALQRMTGVLRNAEERHLKVALELVQLIDNANAPIFGIDDDGKVNEWNQRAEQITGYHKEEVIGEGLVAKFITDDYKKPVKEVLDRALKGVETANYEFPLYTKSGNRVDILLNSSTRRDTSGNITGVVGVGQDITELNKVRIEQENIANELTQLIDNANAPIFGIDDDGRVNEWNQRAEQITGYHKEEVMGQGLVAKFITDDYKKPVKEVLDRALKGVETANYEFPLYTKSGNRVDILLNSTSRRDAAGNITGVVGVGQDITANKSLESQLRKSQKMEAIGHLTSGIAHDFNNILGVVLSNLELIGLTRDPDKISARIARGIAATHRGAALTQRLLSFSKDDVDELRVTLVNDIFDDLENLVAKSLTAKIKVETQIAGDLWLTNINVGELQDSILNLTINAGHAMPKGGILKIRTKNKTLDEGYLHTHPDASIGDFVMISISDNGIGMSPETMENIFDPFFTTKERSKGTGLGLSMTHGFIRRMGGHIEVKSVQGEGSTFNLYLPRVHTDKTLVDNLADNMKKLPSGVEKILVVDDETDLIDSAQILLESLGYEVTTAPDGNSAIEILEKSQNFDLLFSDVVMPGAVNGFDLANTSIKINPKTRILLTSGFAENRTVSPNSISDELESELREKLLRKPYSLDQLAQSIRNTLDE